MFGTGKKIDQLQQCLQQWIDRTEQREKQQAKDRDACENDRLRLICDQMNQLADAAGKQETAVTDMLDTWEEWQDRLDAQAESLQKRLLEKTERELAEKAEQERSLLEMTVSAWDQLFNLRLAARKAGDTSWQRQLELADNALKEKARYAGLQQTGRVGEPFSYDIHEAVERIDTDQPDADMTIADVLVPGYWYRERALRKSRVAVYCFRQEGSV